MRYLQGRNLWYWVKKIAALKVQKIVWNSALSRHDTEIIGLTVDGVNFRAWEKKHPTLNKDPAYYDHKHHTCGFKYEIALMIYEAKIVWTKGSIRCGKGDGEVAPSLKKTD